MDYFYIDESGKKVGPIPENAMRALYRAGVITNSTLICAEDTGEWRSCSFLFGAIGGPLPPPLIKAPPREAWQPRDERPAGWSWWRLAAFVIVVLVAAVGITARFYHLPFSAPGTVFGLSAPWLAGKASAPVAKTTLVTDGPLARKSTAVEKADSLAEWYDFGFRQGLDAKRIFGAFGRKLEPSKAQLAQLLINMELNPASVTPEGMGACFDGYKDGCLGASPACTVAASQRKSSLPYKLRAYRKLEGDESDAPGASSEALDHTLACTVMIVSFRQDGTMQGSGFFIGPGVLVTNRHVVQGGKQFSVRMPDHSIVPGALMAVSDTMDVALVSVSIKEHPMMRIARAQTVRVGDHVTAVGFPESVSIAQVSGSSHLGSVLQQMEATSTFGFISALNRKIDSNDCFQLDLTINHGNSGGPMIDGEGRVIGISTFGLSHEKIERTNFAIKMSAALPFIESHCGFTVELEE